MRHFISCLVGSFTPNGESSGVSTTWVSEEAAWTCLRKIRCRDKNAHTRGLLTHTHRLHVNTGPILPPGIAVPGDSGPSVL